MQMPVVSIIGRPNVGKSTLFNRLARSKKAIVHPHAGVTRDFIEERIDHLGKNFQLIDTGGLIEPIGDALAPAVWQATSAVLEHSTLVLFIVDGRAGLTPADEIIAEKLRKLSKTVFLVVNKIDTPKSETLVGEFYSLGFKRMFGISAEHGRGTFDLLDEIAKSLPKILQKEEKQDFTVRVAIVGRPNVGKSSLLNQLLGRERAIVSGIPGTTRDSFDTECVHKEKRYVFVDTAGIRRKAKTKKHLDKISVIKARRALERADVALIALDPTEKLSHQDIAIARLAISHKTSPILVINKWDLLADIPQAEKEGIVEYLKLKMNFLSFAQIAKTSAARGWGIAKLFEMIDSASDARRKQVPTSELNRALSEIISRNPPPSRGRQAFKILYATQTDKNPPSFLLFVTKPDALTPKYLLYTERALCERFSLKSTPIILKIRGRREK